MAYTPEERAARVKEIGDELKELDILLTADAEDNELRDKWNTLNKERDQHVTIARELEARKARLQEVAQDEKAIERTASTPAVIVQKSDSELRDVEDIRKEHGTGEKYVKALQDNARRAMDRSIFPSIDARQSEDATRSRVENVIRGVGGESGAKFLERTLTSSSDEYQRAWSKAMIQGPQSLSPEESRAMSVGTDGAGGFAVPVQLDPTVILTNDGSVGDIRRISRVVSITGGSWQGITSAGITVARSAEAAEATDNSPTIASPEVTPTRVIADVRYSLEIAQDWPQFLSEMAMMLADAKEREEDTAFVTGTGVGVNPQGVVTGATVVNDAGALTLDLIKTLFATLPARHRKNASFLANLTTYMSVRTLSEGLGSGDGYELVSADRPATLYGRPAYEASAMAVHGAAGGAEKYLLVGDFSKFLIVDKLGMTVEINQHIVGAAGRWTGERAVVAAWRNSSKVLDAGAFRVLGDSA